MLTFKYVEKVARLLAQTGYQQEYPVLRENKDFQRKKEGKLEISIKLGYKTDNKTRDVRIVPLKK